jgi:hypothetical protein
MMRQSTRRATCFAVVFVLLALAVYQVVVLEWVLTPVILAISAMVLVLTCRE